MQVNKPLRKGHFDAELSGQILYNPKQYKFENSYFFRERGWV
jgi:hypothetical protein